MAPSPPSARVLGIPSLTPLDGVASRLATGFTVHRAPPLETALRLRERDADACLLSPIDYARDSSDYMILRGVGLASAEPRGAVTLVFRPGARRVSSLAADPSYASEIVLASIVLAEEFEGAPAIVPAVGTLASMLQRADAALRIGSGSPGPEGFRGLDLIEAWAELTERPYVYGLWCCREGALNDAERSDISSGHLDTPPAGGEFTHRIDTPAEKGLSEFLRYAFYHGILPDMPEVQWYPGATGRDAGEMPH